MESALTRRRHRLGVRLFFALVSRLRYWAIGIIVASFVSDAVLARVRPEVDFGLWGVTVSIIQWFPAVIAGLLLFTQLPVHIARGLTRREYIAALAVFGALTSAATAAVAILGFLAEHAMLELLAEPFRTWQATLGSAARYLLVAPIYIFGGLAIGALSVRIGQSGMLAMVLLVVAGAIYTGALSVEFFRFSLSVTEWAFATWAAGAIALIGVLVATYMLSLRSVPIRPKGA
ncbi:hypothetical protein GCM10027447_19580 [Glycomyces halotolerans]